jgi:hypothetical protein
MFQTQRCLNMPAVRGTNLVLGFDALDLHLEQQVRANNLPALTAPEPVLSIMDQNVHG